jgi:hypothetical protein
MGRLSRGILLCLYALGGGGRSVQRVLRAEPAPVTGALPSCVLRHGQQSGHGASGVVEVLQASAVFSPSGANDLDGSHDQETTGSALGGAGLPVGVVPAAP